MPLANLWGKLNPTNLIAEFIIVTLSVVVALAGDKYLAHRATLEQEQVALELIHHDLKENHKHIDMAVTTISREDSVLMRLIEAGSDRVRHRANERWPNDETPDSTINAGFRDAQIFTYFDRTVANALHYDSKIKLAGKKIIQTDSLSFKLAHYYDVRLNNLNDWTAARLEMAQGLQRIIVQEGYYLDSGIPEIQNIKRIKLPDSTIGSVGSRAVSRSEAYSLMLSNIHIMSQLNEIIWLNGYHRANLVNTSHSLRDAIEAVEAHFAENDVQFVAFDPEATWK